MRRKPRHNGGAEQRSKPKPIIRDRCGATGKVRYHSRGAARQALVSTKRAANIDGDHRRHESRIYPCINCGGFHLTSREWFAPDRLTVLSQTAVIHTPPHREALRWPA